MFVTLLRMVPLSHGWPQFARVWEKEIKKTWSAGLMKGWHGGLCLKVLPWQS